MVSEHLNGVHGAVARFRVSPQLIERAQFKARADGMTLSELIRHALRRELEDAA